MKIEKLTKAQENKLPEYVDKWTKIGLSTTDIDIVEIKKCIKKIYNAANIDNVPETIHIVDSPLACVHLDKELSGQNRENCLSNLCFGNNDASWLSFYDYFKRELHIKECDRMDGLFELALHCGWWSPREDYVIVCRKPTEIHLNSRGFLHNDKGMSVKYLDNFGVWSIDGNIVNEQIVMSPETLTIDQIHKESNMDVRTIMINRFGWPRYIKETKSNLLDSRRNDIEGTIEALYSTKFGKRLLVTCPTGRIFSLGVPDTIHNCVAAQSWLGNDRKLNVIART